MSRRRTGIGALVLALVVALAACGGGSGSTHRHGPPPKPTAVREATPTATEAPQKRPNILVIEADDMRTDELRWMPNVRKFIADRGLSFENSFAPYPLCCPSRASFLTGKYAHNHHVLSHVSPFGFGSFDDRQTMATVLHQSGYSTALIGKYLNGYGQQPVHGTLRPSLNYVPPGWSNWRAGSDHIWHAGDAHQGGTYAYDDLTQNINGKIVSWPGRYNTNVLGEQARQVISADARIAKPWFIWWTPIAPHFGSPDESDDPPDSHRTDGKVERWETPARPDWVKGIFDKAISHGLGTPKVGTAEKDMRDKPSYLRNLPELTGAEKKAERDVTRQRAESIYVMDRQIGKTLNHLRRTGQYDNTVIVFTSDNGYYLGEHRKRQGKINLHEPSLRVPLLIAGPGVPRGTRYDPITTVDLAPTFASYAGLPGMPHADGINMIPVITKGDRGWDRPVVTEARMPEYPKHTKKYGFNSQLNTRGLRLGRWKYTRYSTGAEELYDLKNDPLELESLAANPRYAAIRSEMDTLWLEYKDCREAACAKPLPAAYRTDPRTTKAITDAEARRTELYFGNVMAGY